MVKVSYEKITLAFQYNDYNYALYNDNTYKRVKASLNLHESSRDWKCLKVRIHNKDGVFLKFYYNEHIFVLNADKTWEVYESRLSIGKFECFKIIIDFFK